MVPGAHPGPAVTEGPMLGISNVWLKSKAINSQENILFHNKNATSFSKIDIALLAKGLLRERSHSWS
jgi:hypothetical protein